MEATGSVEFARKVPLGEVQGLVFSDFKKGDLPKDSVISILDKDHKE